MKNTWIELYSIDNCDAINTVKVLAKADKDGDLVIPRTAFLRACKRLGADEHDVRSTEKAYTYTGRSEGNQVYNLLDGIRPLTW